MMAPEYSLVATGLSVSKLLHLHEEEWKDELDVEYEGYYTRALHEGGGKKTLRLGGAAVAATSAPLKIDLSGLMERMCGPALITEIDDICWDELREKSATKHLLQSKIMRKIQTWVATQRKEEKALAFVEKYLPEGFGRLEELPKDCHATGARKAFFGEHDFVYDAEVLTPPPPPFFSRLLIFINIIFVSLSVKLTVCFVIFFVLCSWDIKQIRRTLSYPLSIYN